MTNPQPADSPPASSEPAAVPLAPPPPPAAPSPGHPAERPAGRNRRLGAALAVIVLVVLVAIAVAVTLPGPGTAPAARLAMVDAAGALSVVDGSGGSRRPLTVEGVTFGPPAWSPDGTRLAAIGMGPNSAAVYVFAVPPSGAAPGEPTTVYRSADRPPFYLYWSPDGTRIALLATEPDGISLRTAPADGSPAADGAGADGVLREGAPLYLAWEDAGRLLVHIGVGAEAVGGEVDLSGAAAGPPLAATGDFRAAGASRDGRWVATVRGDAARGNTAAGDVVVEARDGSSRTTVPVFGPAALTFDPAGTSLAWIAADAPTDTPVAFPFGPLRAIDPVKGDTRTLLDSSVAAFFWSPDGRTIAALHLAPALAPTAGAGARLAAASPQPALTLHLAFVDVASGTTRSDRTIRLGEDFIRTVLPYFDQYALSHNVWSPDGASIVLPLVDGAGRTQATILTADGAVGRPVGDAVQAFWAP